MGLATPSIGESSPRRLSGHFEADEVRRGRRGDDLRADGGSERSDASQPPRRDRNGDDLVRRGDRVKNGERDRGTPPPMAMMARVLGNAVPRSSFTAEANSTASWSAPVPVTGVRGEKRVQLLERGHDRTSHR